MIREVGRVWARLYQGFSCWAYKYLDCIAYRWWRTRRRQWRAWWATRTLLVLHPPFAAVRSASATWQLLALYVAALAWESWPLCLPSRWGKQFLWKQGCGCSKAMVLYTRSIYIDQTVNKYLPEPGCGPGARNRKKTWFLPSKGPQSNKRDGCENG